MPKSTSRVFKAGRVVAIDPGVNGGLVCVDCNEAGVTAVTAVRMPATEAGVFDWLAHHTDTPGGLTVGIEAVSGYIGEAHGGHPGSAMFNFGWGYGGLRMAVLALTGSLPVTVRPQTWQPAVGISPRKYRKEGRKKVWLESKSQFKGRMKDLACRLFPEVKVTLAISDALLLAVYLRRKHVAG